jgi:hypothetical protein
MDPTGGGAAVVVGAINRWSLDMKRERADATCFGDTTKVSVQGLPGIEGKLEGVWDELVSPVLFQVAMGEIAPMLELIPSDRAPLYFFTGLAYLDAGIEVAHDGAIKVSGTFAGAGPWTFDAPSP